MKYWVALLLERENGSNVVLVYECTTPKQVTLVIESAEQRLRSDRDILSVTVHTKRPEYLEEVNPAIYFIVGDELDDDSIRDMILH